MRSILLVITTIAFVALYSIGFIAYGFYLMDVEDQYDDYQDVYFDTSTGGIILNLDTDEFGIAVKSWTRMYINSKERDSIDLYTFATKNSYYSKLEVYKTHLNVEHIKHLTISEVKKLVQSKKLKLRVTHQNK